MDGVAKVEVVKQPMDAAHQVLAAAMKQHSFNQHLVDLAKSGKLAEHMAPWAKHSRPLGYNSMISANRTHNERHGDTFHVHAKTAQDGLDAAVKVSARRGEQDKIRFGQGSAS